MEIDKISLKKPDIVSRNISKCQQVPIKNKQTPVFSSPEQLEIFNIPFKKTADFVATRTAGNVSSVAAKTADFGKNGF